MTREQPGQFDRIEVKTQWSVMTLQEQRQQQILPDLC